MHPSFRRRGAGGRPRASEHRAEQSPVLPALMAVLLLAVAFGGPGAGPASADAGPARSGRPAAAPGAAAANAAGQDAPAEPPPADGAAEAAKTGADSEKEPGKEAAKQAEKETKAPIVATGAEGLLRLQRRSAIDRAELKALERDIEEAERRFARASKRFETLDAELSALREAAAAAAAPAEPSDAEEPPSGGVSAVAEAPPPEQIEAAENLRNIARDALDLAIRRRRLLKRRAEVLRQGIALQEEVLAIRSGEAPVYPDADEPAPTTPRQPPSTGGKPAGPATDEPAADTTAAAKDTPDGGVYDHRVASSLRELEQSRRERDRIAAATRRTDRAIDLSDQQLAVLQEQLALEQDVLERTAAAAELVRARLAALDEAGAPAKERAAARRQLAEIEARAEEAAANAKDVGARIADVTAMLDQLKKSRVQLDDLLAEAEQTIESTQRRVEFLQSPWAPHKIVRRLVSAAPRIGAVLAVLIGLWLLAHLLARRFARTYVSRGRRGTREERTERADTLHRAWRSLLNSVFLILGTLVLLDQLGVDVTVLLGGAAIFGVALAFGAQNLFQDYYYGFMILLENQYRIGNVVRIGGISGVVEDITLRMTMLRDLEGVAHFIPHSQVNTVSNLTHYWSRALLDVGVAYKENVDRVMDVLRELAAELRRDPEYGPVILEDAEILGVDQLGDSAVVIRMYIKTVPTKQWQVKREMQRRIKNRFDELGIEIPFPHRSVYLRGGEGEAGEAAQ